LLSTFKLLLAKEIKLIFKGKDLLGYAIGIAIVMSIAVSMPSARIKIPETAGSALMWLIILFSCVEALQRTFTDEMSGKTSDLMKLLVSPSLVFLSKVFSSSVFTIVIALFTTPLLVLWLGFPISRLPSMLPIAVVGSLAIGLSQGIVSYLLARGSSKGMIYPLVVMPIVLPILISLVILTTQVLEASSISYTLLVVVIAQSLAILLVGIAFLPLLERAV